MSGENNIIPDEAETINKFKIIVEAELIQKKGSDQANIRLIPEGVVNQLGFQKIILETIIFLSDAYVKNRKDFSVRGVQVGDKK